MQSHPTPSAHVCTTILPGGATPLANQFPNDTHGPIFLRSGCGGVRRAFHPSHKIAYASAPIGTWWGSETRTDSDGQQWIRHTPGEYFVVDNFGELVAARNGGAA